MSVKTIESVGIACCGCRGCEIACPVNAITFQEDAEGFYYPQIQDACISCGKCLKVCPIANPPATAFAQHGYAAYFAKREQLRQSSSGGIFAALAEEILHRNGVVFGCAEETPGHPRHIWVAQMDRLPLLQGSKYVQSDMSGVYAAVKEKLESGAPVLFSGTPCQVAGLLNCVGPTENLFTADIICHGVPSRKMYQAYLTWLEEKTGAQVQEFSFRSKDKHDWSLTYRVLLKKNEKVKKQERMATFSPYYRHFLKGMNYRHSCYACPFAQKERVSDLTLGDFWGIERVLPEFENPDGVSAVLVNTEKGQLLWEKLQETVVSKEVPVEQIVANNGQLKAPTKRSPYRDSIYQILNRQGYDAVAATCRSRKEELIDGIKDLVPNRTRQKIKKIIKRK